MPLTKRPKQQKSETDSIGMGCGGIAISFTLGALVAAILVPAFQRAQEWHHSPHTSHNMKILGLMFEAYGEESEGNLWPGLAQNHQIWALDLSRIGSDCSSDPGILVSGNHPHYESIHTALYYALEGPNPNYDTAAGLMAMSFAYLGYGVKDVSEFETLVQARERAAREGADEPVRFAEGETELPPFRDGIERLMEDGENSGETSDGPEAYVPVLIEVARWRHKTYSTLSAGADVLYANGKVKWVPLGTFPVVPEVMDVLSGLEPMYTQK